MRTVIYARFSSALQNSRSIEDQVRVCRERASREGWPIVDVFTDYAISGAAGIGEKERPGLSAMLARIEAGGIDQVLAESTDRIARHQGDSFAIRERMEFAGARLFTLSDGEVNDITGTIKGLMDARFRKELGAKIKRGQIGIVAQGRSPAGLAYGYRRANRLDAEGNLIRGLREIDEHQAAIVQRIFAEYVAGQSPRAIAARLNDDREPGPSGATWRASTIAGDRQRRNGILQNRLYAGVIVHNRTSKITDPVTRRVRIRPNPADQWVSQPVPDLRIIDEEMWEAAQAMRVACSDVRPERQRRPRHLLSGLAVCGCCGGGWTIAGNGYWACGLHRDGRGCSNNRTIRTDTLERRVLAGLQDRMLDPELIAIYVREYHLAYEERARELKRDRLRLERDHAAAAGRVNRLVEAVAAGGEAFVEIRDILAEARRSRDVIADELANLAAIPVVTLHPQIADDYRRQVATLSEALASNPASRLEAIPRLRDLIERVVVTPSAQGRGVELEVEGRLAAILALATGTPAGPRQPFTVTAERVKGIEPSS